MKLGDLTLDTIHAGLNGLNLRRQVAADAVANMETPGYIARRVDFEGRLQRAIEAGEPLAATPEVGASSDPVQLPTGNNVRIDKTMVELTDTALRQQLLVEAANAKFRLLRTVIVGQ